MNLGNQLKAAQVEQDEAARRARLKKTLAADEALLMRDLQVRHFFNFAFSVFAFRLERGQVPGSVALGGRTFREAASLLDTYRWNLPYTPNFDWRATGHGVWAPSHPCHALWLEFEEQCSAAGLVPQWTPCHDGVGMESWHELTVVAA